MLKRSMVLVMVLLLLVSFSAVVLADQKATNNNSGVKIHVESDDGDVILIGDALGNETAEGNNPNPILVAGS